MPKYADWIFWTKFRKYDRLFEATFVCSKILLVAVNITPFDMDYNWAKIKNSYYIKNCAAKFVFKIKSAKLFYQQNFP